MAFHGDDISINTFIGVGSAVTGDLRIAGFITVHGDVCGNLEASGKIIVGEKARVKGNITAKSAIIGGVVVGDITASEGIQIFNTATVIGDLRTRHLELEDGVSFHGHCIALSGESEFLQACQQRADRAAILASSTLLKGDGKG